MKKENGIIWGCVGIPIFEFGQVHIGYPIQSPNNIGNSFGNPKEFEFPKKINSGTRKFIF